MSKFKKKEVIDRATAEGMVEMFLDYYEIDPTYVAERMAGAVENHRLGLVKAVVYGRLIIEDSGKGVKVQQVLAKPLLGKDRIVYKELDGEALKASRRASTPQGQLMALMAALGCVPEEELEVLAPLDQSTLSDLGNCFLMV